MGKIRNTYRNVKKKVLTGYQTARLAARVANPLNIHKTVKNAVKGKGIVLPGSKYIGPGNAMNKGKPKSKADALAYQHDIDYDDYIKSGVKKKHVYTRYSDADERLRKSAKKNMHKDPSAVAAYLGMSAKKLLPGKRIRDKKVYGESQKPAVRNEHQEKSDQYQKEKY